MGTNCSREKLNDLRFAVASILNQTYRDFEFIICENNASFEANGYLDSIKDDRVHIIHSKDHTTLTQKLNLCISLAKGDIIARMDDDDVSHPNRLQEQVAFLEKNEQVDVVGCNINCCDATGLVTERRFPEYPQVKDFLFNLPFVHPTLCFRKEALVAVNGYNESHWCNACEDYDILLRLYEKGFRGANIQQVLFDYNIQHSFHTKTLYRVRINEAVTRAQRFYRLQLLPRYSLYVIKPLIVGLVPLPVLKALKTKWWQKNAE